MKSICLCLVALLAVFYFCGNLSAGIYSGGMGTVGEPYIIANAADLLEIGNTPADFDSFFVMTANIDMSGVANNVFIPIGYYATTQLTSLVPFTGYFDGRGYSVSNLSITSTKPGIGLFGGVSVSDAVIENVTVVNPVFTTTSTSGRIGGLVGIFDGIRITNCHVINPTITSSGSHTGGLMGTNWSNALSISDCSVIGGNVSGKNRVGGFAGWIVYQGTHVTRCFSSAQVLSTGTTVSYSGEVGGFVGLANNQLIIEQCFATGNVTGSPYSDYVGGFAGNNAGNIYNCYATGNVSGRERVGGFQGYHGHSGFSTTVQNCYSIGTPTGTSYVGGFTGRLFTYIAYCINCYWDSDTSQTLVSAEGLPMTTSQMQQKASYGGWSSGIWLYPKADYPKLRSFYNTADFNADNIVDLYDFSAMATAWNTQQSESGYDLLYDICSPADGVINIDDFMVLAVNWLNR